MTVATLTAVFTWTAASKATASSNYFIRFADVASDSAPSIDAAHASNRSQHTITLGKSQQHP